jgi:hypothetical protein
VAAWEAGAKELAERVRGLLDGVKEVVKRRVDLVKSIAGRFEGHEREMGEVSRWLIIAASALTISKLTVASLSSPLLSS